MYQTKRSLKLKNGMTVEVYSINVLASELGRTAQTVRKWEIAGILPKALFKDQKTGKRFYSREQIDTIVKCAEESNIRQGYSVSNTSFPNRVHTALKILNQKYLSSK